MKGVFFFIIIVLTNFSCKAQTDDTIHLNPVFLVKAPTITIYKDSISVSYLKDDKTFYDLSTLNLFIAENKNNYFEKVISLLRYDANAYNKGKDIEEILKRNNLIYIPFIVIKE